MSDEPITRDDEMAEMIKAADDEREFRLRMMLHVQESRIWRKGVERRFIALEKTVSTTRNVVSGITSDRSEFRGAWKALGIVITGITAFAALFAWLWTNVFSAKGHP